MFAVSVINLDRYVNIFLNLFDVSLKNLNRCFNIFLTWLSARGPLHNTIQAACNPKNAPENTYVPIKKENLESLLTPIFQSWMKISLTCFQRWKFALTQQLKCNKAKRPTCASALAGKETWTLSTGNPSTWKKCLLEKHQKY